MSSISQQAFTLGIELRHTTLALHLGVSI